MEKINLWCKLVSLVSVISSVIIILIPECSMKKACNTFVSVILIFSVTVPFMSKDNIDLSLSDKRFFENSIDFEKEIDDYTDLALVIIAQDETENYINDLFEKYNVKGECKVICTSEKNNIKIEKIEIEVDIPKYEKKNLYSEICKICSSETEIVINGGLYERD